MKTESQSEELDFDQVRRLVRLVAEAWEIPVFASERGYHLISGMRRIVGAAVSGCVLDRDFRPDGRGDFTPLALDGWDSAGLGTIKVVAEEGSAFNPAVRAMMRANHAVITGRRQDLVADRLWYGSIFVEHHLQPAHLDHGLFSAIRRPGGSITHGIGFHRATNDRPFTERDRNLVRLFHLECAHLLWAPDQTMAGQIGEGLAPRQRQTLELLLQGLTDKEIALRLGISPYTVNQYTKAIYRHYDVPGRAPLISRLLGNRCG
jgi:DNA-binding CsgD family transcriptional regulator